MIHLRFLASTVRYSVRDGAVAESQLSILHLETPFARAAATRSYILAFQPSWNTSSCVCLTLMVDDVHIHENLLTTRELHLSSPYQAAPVPNDNHQSRI